MIPVNNGEANLLDLKIMSATILNLLEEQEDYAADFQTEYTQPIEEQRTSTVMVRLKPSLTLRPTPQNRKGHLARTGVTGGSVELGLTFDEYFKVPVDTMGVTPEQASREYGEAGGEALLAAGNDDLLRALVSGGTVTAFGRNLATASTTGQQVWSALLARVATLVKGKYTKNFVLYVDVDAWFKLIEEVAVLKSATDPRETAAALLGVGKVRYVDLPGSAIAVVAHRAAVAQAKILSGVIQTREDHDILIGGRIKAGTTILEPGAVQVINDGTGTDTGVPVNGFDRALRSFTVAGDAGDTTAPVETDEDPEDPEA